MLEAQLRRPEHWAVWIAVQDRWGDEAEAIGARAEALLDEGDPELAGDLVLAALARAEHIHLEAGRVTAALDLGEAEAARAAAEAAVEAEKERAARAGEAARQAEERATRAAGDAAQLRSGRDRARWFAATAGIAAAGLAVWLLRPPPSEVIHMGGAGTFGRVILLDERGQVGVNCDLDADDCRPGALAGTLQLIWSQGDPSTRAFLVRGGTFVELAPSQNRSSESLRLDGPAVLLFTRERAEPDAAVLEALGRGVKPPGARAVWLTEASP